MNAMHWAVRALLGLAIVATLAISMTGEAGARQSDQGTAGMNQGRNCVGQGGRATVYIDETGANGTVSYVWCEFSDDSGWTCANGDWGTSCESWLVTGGGRGGSRGVRDGVVNQDLVAVEPVGPVSPRVKAVAAVDATSAMAPLEDEG